MLPESSDRNITSLEVHSGRAGGIVDHANGLLMAMPGVHVDPVTLNTLDARDAEQVERVCMAMFQKHLLANDFWSSVGRDLLIYARSFIKAMPLPSVWTTQEGYPVRKFEEKGADYLKRIRKWKETEGKFPFVISHVSALAILPMLDNYDNVLASIEEKWVTAKIIAEEFKDAEIQELLDRKSLNWYDEIPVIEYIDSQHVAYALAGTTPRNRRDSDTQLFQGVGSYRLLRTWTHGLGKNPIVMITGIKTEMNDYEDHFKGFMHDAKDALLLYDVLISRLATMVYAYYLPSYEWQLTSTSAQFAGHDRPQLKVNLGGVTVTYADEKLSPIQPATGLPDADQLLKHTDDIIQRHCAASREKLMLADGREITYGELALSGEKFKVFVPGSKKKRTHTPSAWANAFPAAIEPLYEIELESGIKFLRTAHHKIAINARAEKDGRIVRINGRKNINWVECDKIKAGDYAVVLNQIQRPVSINPRYYGINPDTALLIGLLMGDGCINERGAHFRQNDGVILNLFEDTCKKIGQPYSREKNGIKVLLRGYSGGNHKLLPITKEKTPLLYAIKRLGLAGQRSRTKVLPSWTKDMSRKSTIELFRGLILSDGSVGKTFSYASISKELRDWVADVAYRFGCPGRKTDNGYCYYWTSYTEFTQHLANQLGSFQGKLNNEEIYVDTVKHTRRKLNKQLHRQKVVSVSVLPPEPTVCVTVLDENNSHVYATPVVEHNTLEDVLFGRVAGTAPAFQVSLRINVAKSKLTPIAQHMAQGLTNVFELFLRGVINLGEKVIISGEEISPKMAEKYKSRVAVTIQPKSPQERGQDIGSAKMALEIGLPWDWVVENLLDIEDPATLRMKKDIQDLEELPPVKERLMGDALTEMEALIQQNDYTDIEGIDYGSLPPEFAQAIQSILGSTSGEQASKLEGLLSGQTKPGIDTSGVGRGPFPEGAAPQSLSPRGLLSEKTQPAPGSAEVDLGLLGVPGGG